MFSKMKQRKARKGFSLVELVVVILIIAILAVAVFAGGSAAIKKSQVSRTTSDLHNFSIAIESAMNEVPSVANMNATTFDGSSATDMKAIVNAVNNNLPADYQLDTVNPITTAGTGNLTFDVTGTGTHLILKSAKTDAWDNNYYAIFDFGERHAKGQSDFYITVVSAGANAQTVVGGAIEQDDIFLLVQYSDGDVSAVTYKVEDNNMTVAKVTAGASGAPDTFELKTFNESGIGKTVTIKGTAGTMKYAGGSATNASYMGYDLPVNF